MFNSNKLKDLVLQLSKKGFNEKLDVNDVAESKALTKIAASILKDVSGAGDKTAYFRFEKSWG